MLRRLREAMCTARMQSTPASGRGRSVLDAGGGAASPLQSASPTTRSPQARRGAETAAPPPPGPIRSGPRFESGAARRPDEPGCKRQKFNRFS